MTTLDEFLEGDSSTGICLRYTFLDLRHQSRVGQDGERLLKALEVIRTDQHHRRAPVAGDDDPFLLLLHPVGDFREVRLYRRKWHRLAHDPNYSHDAAGQVAPDGAVFSGKMAACLHGLPMDPCNPFEMTLSIAPTRQLERQSGQTGPSAPALPKGRRLEPQAQPEVVDPECIEHQRGSKPGAEGVKETIRTLRAWFSDFHLAIDDLAMAGDMIWSRNTGRGVNTGSVMGRPPTGKSMSIDVIDIVRFRDGRIVEHWGVPDQLGMMMQLGLLAKPEPVPAERH